MFEISDLIDLRLLLVLSPITTAIAWAMFINSSLTKIE
ncbi:MAG: photosystem II protein Y [Cyanobacteria bacterium P01_H01_bin.119]